MSTYMFYVLLIIVVYLSPVSVRMNKLRRASWADHLGELGLVGKVSWVDLAECNDQW